MKRSFARIAVLALAVMIVAAVFAACAGKSKSPQAVPSGVYYLKTIDGRSVEEYLSEQAEPYGMTLDEFLSLSGLTRDDLDDFMTLSFDGGGTGELAGKGIASSGFTWQVSGENLLLTETGSGAVDTCQFRDNTVTLISNDGTMVFGK